MKKTLRKHLETKLQVTYPIIERPKESGFGHFASPIAFALAKTLKKAPHAIASELVAHIADEHMFDSIEAVSGFLNFKLSSAFLDSFASTALASGESFAKLAQTPTQRILLEFVSANPTGPLHIGHARGAIYGDALLKIGRYLGYHIDSEYYINDAGRQVWLLGLSIWLRARESLNLPFEMPEEYYRGEYITELSAQAVEALGEDMFKNDESISKLSEWGKERMMEEIRSNLAGAGIQFDRFVSEKEQFAAWPSVHAHLQSHDGIYEQDGKLWLRSSEKGDEKDRVVVRENGEPTYLAGDIAYHANKFERDYDRYINIWGADHHGYISRVKASLEFLGHDSTRLEILLSQMVALLKGGEPYKMSKRAGNFILMKDVVDDIGAEALRFVFLSKKADTHLDFDVADLAKEDSSNPIFYINYAHARIHSIFAKCEKTFEDAARYRIKHIDDDAKELLFRALLLPDVLEDAFETREPHRVTDYLKSLCTTFHKFYNDHKVAGSENEMAYLKIFAVVALTIKTALGLLGVHAKERM